jgi:23S rRNA (uracil-5-)-methyltransferase RumA
VYCDRIRTLWGQDYYYEEILGLKFKVTPFSFFQTNTEAAERLYSYAVGLIPELEGKTVFDLYSGTGTISQIMALRAKKVVGIELVEEAVEAARLNAELNGLTNCEFISGDVFRALDRVEEKPDVIVVDPPRAGILPKALRKILDYRVDTIVYVSCNPRTLAQNLAVMQQEGYRAVSVKTFDNFPFTKHVETVCLLTQNA